MGLLEHLCWAESSQSLIAEHFTSPVQSTLRRPFCILLHINSMKWGLLICPRGPREVTCQGHPSRKRS